MFHRTPLSPDSPIKINSLRVHDSTGQDHLTDWTQWNGDALSGEKTGALTVVLPPPADGTTSVDIHLSATETGPNEATATLEFPAIKWLKEKK